MTNGAGQLSSITEVFGIDPQPPINLIGQAGDLTNADSGIASVIAQKIQTLTDSAREEIFEGGMENELSLGLISLLYEYGNDVIAVLSHFIACEALNEEIAAEILRWLGRLDHSSFDDVRLRLLERCLDSPSARLRDAAAVALAALADPRAIPDLKQAIAREKYAELREDMEQALAQLESAR